MMDPARDILDWLQGRREAMAGFLESLVRLETPTGKPDRQAPALALVADELAGIGFGSRVRPCGTSGGVLWGRPRRVPGRPAQLLLGHLDTVWPLGTLASMPHVREGSRIRGPGVYDMKGGVVQMVFALKVLETLGLSPPVAPLVIINTDEENGSRDSRRWIQRAARVVDRALVLEPSLGPEGRLKTARKGVGRFTLVARGEAAHAGLDPGGGASAIMELSHQIQRLFGLNDLNAGISVNVGTVDGGLGANVIAPEARCEIDVRVPTQADAERLEASIRGLQPVDPGVTLEVTGRFGRPPMEPNGRNLALWHRARACAERLTLDLLEGTAGGGSDGNLTSAYTATLDGLGAVGNGAHAPHEYLELADMPKRAALLALLVLEPALSETRRSSP